MKCILGITGSKERPFIDIINNGCKQTFGSYSYRGTETFYYYDGEYSILPPDLTFPVPPVCTKVGYMTLGFFKYLVENIKFDYIFKSSMSCYVDQQALYNFLQNKPLEKFCCGTVFGASHSRFNNDEYPCISGSCNILSYDLVKLIYDNSNNWDHDIAEDRAISKILYQNNIEFVNGIQQNIETVDQANRGVDIHNNPLNLHHTYCYRVKGYNDPGERKIDVEIMHILHKKLGLG
jgi:hypothetical protein